MITSRAGEQNVNAGVIIWTVRDNNSIQNVKSWYNTAHINHHHVNLFCNELKGLTETVDNKITSHHIVLQMSVFISNSTRTTFKLSAWFLNEMWSLIIIKKVWNQSKLLSSIIASVFRQNLFPFYWVRSLSYTANEHYLIMVCSTGYCSCITLAAVYIVN